jgi:uncharacterized protein (DUF697 family)
MKELSIAEMASLRGGVLAVSNGLNSVQTAVTAAGSTVGAVNTAAQSASLLTATALQAQLSLLPQAAQPLLSFIGG